MKPGERLILPVWFRVGLVTALCATLLYSYNNRLSQNAGHQQVLPEAHGPKVASQSLRFIDLDGGSVSVVDATSNTEIMQLLTGEGGFMRSVMRGFVRERKSQGLGPEVPFELTVWEDGLVSLIDPATNRRVELSAFGRDNVAAFTRLLPHSRNLTSGAS